MKRPATRLDLRVTGTVEEILSALAADDSERLAPTAVKLECEFRVRGTTSTATSERANGLVRETGLAVCLTSRLTAFAVSVGNVSGLGAEKQVCWPHATAIVAMVADT